MSLSKRWLVLVLVSLGLAGCASTNSETESGNGQMMLVTPLQPDANLEVALAKISEVLISAELTEEQRARFLYDRGVLYDSVGLRTLARIDFSRALQLRPDLPDAYNFMGIYLTQAMEFDQAYEAFDAVLELDPGYDFAYLNRGIALYYGSRPMLAVDDLNEFYQRDQSDAYRALWLYLAEYQQDPVQAKAQLRAHSSQIGDGWGAALVAYYLGDIDGGQLLAASRQDLNHQKQLAERLCEAYFYMGKQARMEGQPRAALNLFKLSLATNVYEFVEHRYSIMEMRQIAEQLMEEQEQAH
ncbi:lipoprotein NlpI [Ferrimonas sp. SCSIO 43195]|uniref:lipoprotein NlpI n=1 Tax=Ferrimonas sp. SCSIO 43195 TaxID=2822844 RepID=UPI00207634FD|nr:lipoprotein NlpI [Ferrimonas sp. SCSIO 43195]USD38466.1 lipoprotein NlpI [Ferrimonas sp. SCSIO 43195]